MRRLAGGMTINETLATCGAAQLDRHEVKCRREHHCEDCGRPICKGEFAVRTVHLEPPTVRVSYSCCRREWE